MLLALRLLPQSAADSLSIEKCIPVAVIEDDENNQEKTVNES